MRPNFIFILADDLGFADLGCYGGLSTTSPRLDALANEGIRFTRAYANSPVCSPTRFALITGRYQYRLRGAAEEPLTGRYKGDKIIGLPPSHPTFPSLLKKTGYHNSLIGKWHLGYPPHFGPLMSGYDEHWGLYAGGADYLTHTDNSNAPSLFHNGEPIAAEGYLTDLLSDRAAHYVAARGQDREPFLLSLHYTAPHWPWQTREDKKPNPDEPQQSLMHLDGGSIQVYQRMIQQMDEGIGKVLDALEKANLSDNTIVVFTSDNGGERFSNNWPLIGGKMDLTEGGIRVPCIVRWPKQIKPGRVSAHHILTMDWAATFLEAAGVDAAPDFPLDGVSLLNVLKGAPDSTERALYWRMKHNDQRALREGRWKYLACGQHEYLFDVETDERERANLAKRYPERLSDMRAKYARWDATMPPIPIEARTEIVYTAADMPKAE